MRRSFAAAAGRSPPLPALVLRHAACCVRRASDGRAIRDTVLLHQGASTFGPRGADTRIASLRSRFTAALLPRGYPGSVREGYIGYCQWLGAGLFAHSYGVCASMNAMLQGFFVESTAANWILKDLLPPIVAGWLAVRTVAAESMAKQAFVTACACNSVLYICEFLVPHVLPSVFWLPLATLSGVGKMACYLVIGASRAVLQKALAKGNLGEVTAKLGTIGMVMHGVGSLAALSLAAVSGFWVQLAALAAVGALGVYAPMRAAQCVRLRALGAADAHRLAASFADAPVGWKCPSPPADSSWFVPPTRLRAKGAYGEGRPNAFPVAIAPHLTPAAAASVLRCRGHLSDAAPKMYSLGLSSGAVVVVFDVEASAEDVLSGVLVAELLARERPADGDAAADALAANMAQWSEMAAAFCGSIRDSEWAFDETVADDAGARVRWSAVGAIQ